MMNALPHEAEIAVKRLQDFDASAKVFVIIAHDVHLQGLMPVFLRNLTTGVQQGTNLWADGGLKDFLNGVE